MLMSKARLTSSELARCIDVPAATIKRIRNNEHANPTIATLLPIARYFSISLDEFICGASYQTNNSKNKIYKVPLLSWQECIHYSSLDHDKINHWVMTEKEVSDSAFAVRMEKQELEHFPKGGILIIETEFEAENNDHVIVANMKNYITSIREYITEIDEIYLKSLVPGLGISKLTSELKIIGVIIQYKLELK